METNTTPINTPELTQQHEQQAWQLRVRGWSQERIAEALDLDQSTVSRILKRVRTRLAAEFTQEVVEMRLEQTEQLFHIIDEALQAWEESKPKTNKTPQSSPEAYSTPLQLAGGPCDAASPAAPKQCGHCGYLKVALQAYQALREIWGLSVPKKARAQTAAEYVPPPLSAEVERFRKELRASINAQSATLSHA